MKTDLFDKLDEVCNFPLPQMMIDEEFKVLWQQVESMRKQDSMKDKSEDTLKEEYLKLAKRRVKLGILLSTMAKQHNIQVEQADLIESVRAQAMANPSAAQAIIKYYTENPKALDQLKGPILEEKTVQQLFNEVITIEKSIKVKKLLEVEKD